MGGERQAHRALTDAAQHGEAADPDRIGLTLAALAALAALASGVATRR